MISMSTNFLCGPKEQFLRAQLEEACQPFRGDCCYSFAIFILSEFRPIYHGFLAQSLFHQYRHLLSLLSTNRIFICLEDTIVMICHHLMCINMILMQMNGIYYQHLFHLSYHYRVINVQLS